MMCESDCCSELRLIIQSKHLFEVKQIVSGCRSVTASHTSHTNNNYATHAHRHVRFAAGVHGLSHRVDQVAADAKVAHLDLALSVDQHVGGLHIYGGTETTRQTLKIRLIRDRI